jgi:hypothetical protein
MAMHADISSMLRPDKRAAVHDTRSAEPCSTMQRGLALYGITQHPAACNILAQAWGNPPAVLLVVPHSQQRNRWHAVPGGAQQAAA